MSHPESTPLVPLAGFAVAVSSFLTGSKRAVQQGNTIFVSPAMWDLLSHAESQEELRLLLDKIEVPKLPEVSFFSPVYSLVFTVSPTSGTPYDRPRPGFFVGGSS